MRGDGCRVKGRTNNVGWLRRGKRRGWFKLKEVEKSMVLRV